MFSHWYTKTKLKILIFKHIVICQYANEGVEFLKAQPELIQLGCVPCSLHTLFSELGDH